MIRPIVFGKFCLLERISVGGMAEVYRAKLLNAPHFNRFLAIKRILPNLAADREFISMFIDEAKITVELNHPNICQIYELGRLEDSHYIAMEYIPGRDLLAMQNRYRRQKKIMSVSQASFITAQVGQGLDYAHRATDAQGRPLRVIHRDVSPQNALVSYEGLIKLIDFGVAKAASKNSKTQAGVLKGKFGYMSPEQVDGNGVVDHRSDIFALGTVFWELLTGRRLFHGDSEFATLELVRECKVTPPSKLNRLVPTEVEAIVMKALDPNPNLRYQWAGEMVRDLWAFLNSCNPPYTQWHLQNWMCTNFAEDLEKEWEKLPVFQQINTLDDVRSYNSAALEKAEAQMRAQLAPARDFEGNVIPELEDTEDFTGDSTQVFTPEFDFNSVDSESVDPEIPETEDPTNASGPPPSAPKPPGPPPVPKPPAPPTKPESATESASPSSAPSQHNKPLAPPGLPEVAQPGKPNSDPEAQPLENPLHQSIFYMDAVVDYGPLKKKKRNTVILITLVSILILSGIGLATWALLTSNAPEKQAEDPKPSVAAATISVLPSNPAVQLQITTIGGDPVVKDEVLLETLGDGVYELSNLPPGSYFFLIEHPDYVSEKREVKLISGHSEVRIQLQQQKVKTGTIELELPAEDARVYVNGDLIEGAGTTRMLELPAGEDAEIVVKANGHMPFSTILVPVEDTPTALPVKLEKALGSLTVQSTPSAELFVKINDKWESKGNTPKTIEKLDATLEYEIEVRKRGYTTWTKTVAFDDYFEKSYLATLVKE